mmetsp:Transcript_34770/g.98569  ORF Transcript_34770/g.98569 Transcript_34770/m.98569 type:complete len:311 (-) Transcript_34770:564-1496(-)
MASAIPAESRGKVEAEAIHMVLLHPLHQAVNDHLLDNGVVAVDCVPAAGEVEQLHIGVLVQLVIHLVVQAAETEEVWVIVTALRRVVVNNIQEDLNAGLMEGLHHLLELPACSGRPSSIGSKAAHGGEEVDVGVAPDVDHVLPRVGGALELELIVLKHRQQLNGVDAELLQVWHLLLQPCEGPALPLGEPACWGGGERPHRGLKDDHVVHGYVWALDAAPVKGLGLKVIRPTEYAAGLGLKLFKIVADPEEATARHKGGIGVQQFLVCIPAVAGVPATVPSSLYGIKDALLWKALESAVPDVAGAVHGEL